MTEPKRRSTNTQVMGGVMWDTWSTNGEL